MQVVTYCKIKSFGKIKYWRTRLQPIRTASEIQAKIIIQPLERIPLYQKLAQKVKELHLLGMTYEEIAKSLDVSKKTVKKARRFIKR
jgi:DNA-binding NarL/FixJ family response regulator